MTLSPNTSYQVQVRATNADGDGPWSPPGSGRTLAAPKFADETAAHSIPENTPPNQNVGAAIRATDADNDALTYSLEGTDAASFDIEPLTGQIKTRSRVYDHETQSSYFVTVRASDPTDASDTIAVTVNLTDEDEPPLAPAAPSVSSESTTSLSVVWTAPDNTGRPTITSYDLQYRQGTSGSWTNDSQILSGTSRSATIPDPNSNLTLSPNTPYQVQVRATNADGDGPWSPPGSGRTLDEDNTNTAPDFADDTDTRSIPENTGPDQNVGAAFMATDTDNDPLTYALEGQDAASFDLETVGTSAQIRTKPGVTYDHEVKSTYFVTLKADDGKGGTDVIAVTISVTDEDEPPDAPAAPSVSSASTTSLSVIWSPPDNNAGRPPITGYRLKYREVGTPSWTGPRNQSGTSTIITNLNADTQY